MGQPLLFCDNHDDRRLRGFVSRNGLHAGERNNVRYFFPLRITSPRRGGYRARGPTPSDHVCERLVRIVCTGAAVEMLPTLDLCQLAHQLQHQADHHTLQVKYFKQRRVAEYEKEQLLKKQADQLPVRR